MRSSLIGIILSSIALHASAQKFVGESKLNPVEADGFYNLAIDPSISRYLNGDFTNIRIHDDKGLEVPYLLQTESPNYFTTTFKSYEIVDKKQIKNCCTSLILANADNHSINNISLSIRNAEVTKEATLQGSDDKENWYALKDRFSISSIANASNTSQIEIVDFPLSNYSFYKIDIVDSTSAPLNILAAGYYENKSEEGKYTKIPVRSMAKDSVKLKKTFIGLSFDSSQVVDRLMIEMKGATYFLREADLYIKRKRINRKKREEYYYDYFNPVVMSSKQASVIEMNGQLVKDLRIVIDNKDNQPLQLAHVDAFQLNRYLTALLKGGKSYSVMIAERNLQAPVYDIGNFKDQIPASIPTLKISSPKMFASPEEVGSSTIFTSNIFVWVAIVIVIAVLGFMAVKMVRETSTRQE